MPKSPAQQGRTLFAGPIPSELAGLRLEQAVQQLGQLSRREARLLIALGHVCLGTRRCRILARAVVAGQQLSILLPLDSPNAPGAKGAMRETPLGSAPQADRRSPPLRVLHLDRHVVAVDKPAGLLSENDRFGAPSVESLLPRLLAARNERGEVWLVHRLDAGTSGVLVLARSRGAARALSTAFRTRTAAKRYLALCAGQLVEKQVVAAALGRVSGTKQGVLPATDPRAKAAETALWPKGSAEAVTLVEARPKTGRSHQIRVHLAHLGHAIVGDALYGGPRYLAARAAEDAAPPVAIGRPLLHAWSLVIDHPEDGRPLRLTAPLPADFLRALAHVGLKAKDIGEGPAD